jgi:hypothetical protein
VGDDSSNGGWGAVLALKPIQSGLYKGMVIFVDRVAAAGGIDDTDLNGGGSILNVSGTIYAASGVVKFNESSTDVNAAQVICCSFQVNGSGASFTLDYNPGNLFHGHGRRARPVGRPTAWPRVGSTWPPPIVPGRSRDAQRWAQKSPHGLESPDLCDGRAPDANPSGRPHTALTSANKEPEAL